jgi:pilus assembly protein CpaE
MTGMIIWASNDAGLDRSLLESTATELGMAVRFRAPAELADAAVAEHARVVGLAAGGDPAETLKVVAQLHARLPRTAVLVAASGSDLSFVRAAIEAGASDVLSLPLQPAELNKAFLRALRSTPRTTPAPESRGEVLTICAARGGLGATTIAVNLAAKLAARTGDDTALVDLDLQRGDVASFLNLSPVNSIANFAAAPSEIDDLFLASTLIRHPNGVFVMPAPPEIEDADSVGHDEVKLALDLLRAEYRWIVVDTARTITGATAAALEASGRIFILSDLSVPGVRAARRMVELFGRLELPLERVELLVTEAVPGPVGLQEAARAVGKQPYFVIPRDDASAAEAMNHGTPLNGRPTKLTLAMSDLAAKVAGVSPAGKPKGTQLFRKLFGRTEGDHA